MFGYACVACGDREVSVRARARAYVCGREAILIFKCFRDGERTIRIFFGLLYWVLVNFLNKFDLCQLRIVSFLWLILQELLDNLGVFLRLADIGRRFDILIIETAFLCFTKVKVTTVDTCRDHISAELD